LDWIVFTFYLPDELQYMRKFILHSRGIYNRMEMFRIYCLFNLTNVLSINIVV